MVRPRVHRAVAWRRSRTRCLPAPPDAHPQTVFSFSRGRPLRFETSHTTCSRAYNKRLVTVTVCLQRTSGNLLLHTAPCRCFRCPGSRPASRLPPAAHQTLCADPPRPHNHMPEPALSAVCRCRTSNYMCIAKFKGIVQMSA